MRSLEIRKKILEYLKQHLSFNEKEEVERLESLKNDESIVELWIDQSLVGVFQIKRWKNYENNQCAEIILGCDLNEKTLLVAKARLKQLHASLKSEGVTMISSCVNDDYSLIADIVKELNYTEWYGFVFNRHNQSTQMKSTLKKRIIEKDDFEMYYREMGLCFVPMREAMDIKPYNVCDVLFKDEQSKEKEFNQWLNNANNTWMYFNQNNEWVGSGLIVDQDLDDIFVVSKFQNRGYGRQIVSDLIQQSQNKGFSPFIGYVKWNKKAGYLYESLGFVPFMSCTYYRTFIDK